MLKFIEIPLPKLKFKKNCPWELKSINTVLIFILESWDLKTREYVFDVKTCKQMFLLHFDDYKIAAIEYQ